MKKVVSLVLVFAIVFSLMAGLGITSDAGTNGHSQADALAWLNSKIGIQIGNGQCPALAREYYAYLGYSVSGNGKDYENNVPSGWSRTYYSSGFIPQPGDVAVWRSTNTTLGKIYGHVAIVKSGSSSNMVCYEQGNSAGNKVRTYTYSYGSVTCFIRPDFKGGTVTPTKTPENLGDNFYAFIIKKNSWKHLAAENGNVQIASSGNDSSNPKQIWHFIRQSNGTYKIVNEYDSHCMEAVNYGTSNGTNIATYIDNGSTAQRWYIYKNSNGYNLSPSYSSLVIDANGGKDTGGTNIQLWPVNNADSQRFSIYKLTEDGVNYSKPSKPSVSKPTVSISNKTVTITWSASKTINKYDNRVYDIRIYKGSTSGEPIFSRFNISGTKYTYTASDSGKYYVTLAAVNTKYYAWYNISDAVSFNISTSTSCSHTYTSAVTRSATCTVAGVKTFTCSKCGYQYTQTISALGHDWKKDVHPALTMYNVWQDGYIESKCSRCSASTTNTIKAINKITLSSTCYVYNGKVHTPSTKVVDGNGKVLKKGTDYNVVYQGDRKSVNEYWVRFEFIGNYSGEVNRYFKIIPKGTSLSKLTAGKKSFKAKWKKTSGIDGYQLQYSTKSNFSGAKKVTVYSASTLSKTIKKLSAKKVYYVRVRTYKIAYAEYFMSNWSKTYKVKTK